MGLARSTLHITRPYSSLLAFLSILVAVFGRSGNLSLSLGRAAPLLFISFCTYIINDLDDIEKDRINHPDRPLPKGELKPTFVTIVYFICLASALFTTRIYIGATPTSFLYYLVLIASISYRYIVEYLASLKPVYVAAVCSIPVLIVLSYYPQESSLYIVAISIFLFVLGREICKDLLDRAGDPVSLLHKIDARHLAIIGFAALAVGLFMLSMLVDNLLGAFDILAMALLLGVAAVCWFRLGRVSLAINTMKGIIFLGLYFLL